MAASLSIAASRPRVKGSGESLMFGWDFGPLLNSGETISSVTHVQCAAAAQVITDGAAVATGDLTIGSPSANVAAFENGLGGTVAIGEGAQVRISGGVHGGDYTIRCRVVTSDSNTREMWGYLQIRDPVA